MIDRIEREARAALALHHLNKAYSKDIHDAMMAAQAGESKIAMSIRANAEMGRAFVSVIVRQFVQTGRIYFGGKNISLGLGGTDAE